MDRFELRIFMVAMFLVSDKDGNICVYIYILKHGVKLMGGLLSGKVRVINKNGGMIEGGGGED